MPGLSSWAASAMLRLREIVALGHDDRRGILDAGCPQGARDEWIADHESDPVSGQRLLVVGARPDGDDVLVPAA